MWFKNRRAKCRQQQKAAEQASKTASHAIHHHQPRPNSASSHSNTSVTGGTVRLPVGVALDGDGGAVKSTAVANDDDVDDDRLIYRHHGSGGGLLVASSAARPSCGWVPASLPPLLRQSSDTFAGPYRVGSRLHSGPGCPSAAAAAMFASRPAGYPGSPYGSVSELGGYGAGGWSFSVTQDAYCNGSAGDGGEACVQFLGPTSTSYGATAVPLFLASPYDHEHHHQHHIQHYHQQHQQQKQQQQLDDDDLDDDVGEYSAETSRRVTVQSADDKEWIKYQPL